MENVEEVGDCADEGDEDAEGDVDLHAAFSADDGQEEVEWVQEQADDADHEEDVVPLAHRFRSRVEDLVPPWPFLPEIERHRHLPEPGRGGRVRVETVHHVSGIDRTPQTCILTSLSLSLGAELSGFPDRCISGKVAPNGDRVWAYI